MPLKLWCAAEGEAHCPLSTAEGAATQTFLALATRAFGGGGAGEGPLLKSGAFFDSCEATSVPDDPSDPAEDALLFDKSREWAGLAGGEGGRRSAERELVGVGLQ